MATNDKKLLTLDHIQYIKDYIDDANSNINKRIENVETKRIVDAINEATESIQKTYDAELDKLTKKIAQVEAAGNTDELATLNFELNALKANTADKFNALATLQEQLYKVSSDLGNLSDGVNTGQIFSAGQLNEIINNTLINQTIVTEDMVAAPNAYAENLVALIGKFGKIKAANIEGGDISGHNIKSSNTVLGTDTPVWAINDGGDGWLAKGNIAWDTDGNVTFSDNVKISFDNVNGATDKLRDLMHEYDAELESYVNEAIKDNTAIAASKEELNKVKSDIETELLQFEDSLNSSLEALNIQGIQNTIEQLSEDILAYANKDYESQIKDLQTTIAGIDDAIANAVAEGNAEIADKLETYKASLTRDMNVIEKLYVDTKSSMLAIQSDIKNIQNSSLDPNAIAEILETALINNTKITDGSISTPTMLAKKIVGLVGKFGTIKASKISGTHIDGYTMSSPLEEKDSEGNPVYETVKNADGTDMLDEEGNPVYVYETVKNADGTDMLDEEGNPVYVTEYDETLNEDVPVRKKVVKDIDDAAWVLKADGSGHLANGKISWDSAGQLNVSGNIGQVNGDKIGPWTLVEETDDKKYITDERGINAFGNDGSFKIGGDNGIYKNDNGIQFGNDETGFSLDTNGNLTFGSGVTLSWNNVTDNNNVANKSDIPSLDDYVTKDYLSGDVFTEIGENWIKTADITCRTLDTIPDEEIDKIKIQDNTICCIGDNGKQNLIISSNNVNTELIGEILASTQEYEYNSNMLYVHDMGFVYLDTPINNFEYTNSTEYTNISTPEKIGYCTKNSKLSFQPCVIPYKVGQAILNPNSISQYVNNSNWEIVGNCYINLHKYNATNESWSNIRSIALKPTSTFGGAKYTNWDDLTSSMNDSPSLNNAYIKRYKQSISITIEEAGVYGVTISFNANSINCATNTNNESAIIKSMQCFSNVNVENNITNFADNYTEIGKDGIITYDGNNLLMCTSNGVEIRSKRFPTSTNFYGLKVCPNGIFVAYGDSSSKVEAWEGWKKIDLKKLKTLFVEE